MCAEAAGKAYSEDASNSELLALLRPVAKYAWHSRFGGHGALTGGMLLHEMLGVFNATVERLVAPAFAPSPGQRRSRVLLGDGEGAGLFGICLVGAVRRQPARWVSELCLHVAPVSVHHGLAVPSCHIRAT